MVVAESIVGKEDIADTDFDEVSSRVYPDLQLRPIHQNYVLCKRVTSKAGVGHSIFVFSRSSSHDIPSLQDLTCHRTRAEV
mmetsp:Transcript_60787/g.148922  ORF Transcript_60787/g.148922 Transcript_60787/m.148922 type:complete len:81 (+) Transcript_60787:789-1031(+)